jgi:kinesin family protein 2/24
MGGDSGDAVMARWLQSAGLQHLAAASSTAGGAADYRAGMPAGLGSAGAGSMLSSLLMQVRFLWPSLFLSLGR